MCAPAMYRFCILGAGITGLGLLLLLHEAGVPLDKIVIIDPHYDGGDLARKWTTVLSNTPWSKTFAALREACPALQINPLFSSKPMDNSTPLSEIAELLRACAAPLLRGVRQIQGEATRVEHESSTKTWHIYLERGGAPVQARCLLLAQGASPRSLDLPIPSIPLEIALDQARLRHYIRPGQRLLVFGTMHSGTLVMRNAVDCSATVVGLYNTAQPFVWDRDGAYDGIKREAADIADAITAGRLPAQLVHTQDTAGVIRASAGADWVVYAMGFQPRRISLKVDGREHDCTAYDGSTGALRDVPAAWGFGVAYPNRAPDGVHWDVSVAAFLAHIKSQIPGILIAASSV